MAVCALHITAEGTENPGLGPDVRILQTTWAGVEVIKDGQGF
jgi:hypothetical protein